MNQFTVATAAANPGGANRGCSCPLRCRPGSCSRLTARRDPRRVLLPVTPLDFQVDKLLACGFLAASESSVALMMGLWEIWAVYRGPQRGKPHAAQISQRAPSPRAADDSLTAKSRKHTEEIHRRGNVGNVGRDLHKAHLVAVTVDEFAHHALCSQCVCVYYCCVCVRARVCV